MLHQRTRGATHARRALMFVIICGAAIAGAAIVRGQPGASKDTAFDELYQRGQRANGGLKTLTARFIETTTSPLLTRPLVARGTLALQRPSTVVLRYDMPEARTVLIDDTRLILSWPGRNIHQTRNIGQMQSRIQKYFVDGDPDELRKSFDITVTDAEKRAGADHIVLDASRDRTPNLPRRPRGEHAGAGQVVSTSDPSPGSKHATKAAVHAEGTRVPGK